MTLTVCSQATRASSKLAYAQTVDEAPRSQLRITLAIKEDI